MLLPPPNLDSGIDLYKSNTSIISGNGTHTILGHGKIISLYLVCSNVYSFELYIDNELYMKIPTNSISEFVLFTPIGIICTTNNIPAYAVRTSSTAMTLIISASIASIRENKEISISGSNNVFLPIITFKNKLEISCANSILCAVVDYVKTI